MRVETGTTCRGRGYRLGLVALIAALLTPGLPSRALVVQADAEQVTRAPAAGIGFEHVGKIAGTTGVYVGAGWVLTAGHVGAGELSLGGVGYPPVPGSWVRVRRAADASDADLGLFRVDPRPPLPRLEIARRPAKPGDPLLLVGCGLARGEAFEWDRRAGWRWSAPGVCRWGRNRVAAVEVDAAFSGVSTRAFETYFSEAEPHEAQAAHGDSGGAGFAPRRGRWVLAGIMIAVKSLPLQPANSSVIGNTTYFADLSHYRAEILAIVGPEPSGGDATR
jgi:hypothetical protein